MPALVLEGPGRAEVREVPVPRLEPDDVLVEVEHCGVCGTDLHLVLQGWGRPGSTPGHEWAGIVAEVGEAVSDWRPGDAVVGGGTARCGRCAACTGGRPSLCADRPSAGAAGRRGAFARYTAAPGSTLLARPAGMSSRVAALAEPLAVALHGIDRGGVRPGHRVAVFGVGPIGALTVAALRARGIDDVVCVEPLPRRQRLAIAAGATHVLSPDDLAPPSVLDPGSVADDAVDVAIECSGNARAMEAALGQLRRGGTLVLVGAGLEPPQLDPNRILLNELVVSGAFEYGPQGVSEGLGMLATGRLPVDHLVEPDDVPLAGAVEAMQALASGEIAGKVLVAP
jgi:(R,R)-butanediol dehydrogenase/meso-butanediol dehydrogenase/diacetyl reductase